MTRIGGWQNRHAWVTSHHPEWTDNYAATKGQIGDSDRLHQWHYGDGELDRSNEAAINAARTEAKTSHGASVMKPRASVNNFRQS